MKVRALRKTLCFAMAALLLAAPSFAAVAAEARSSGNEASGAEHEQSIAERWGIEIESIRLSAANYMLDFRYRVIDAEKARPLHRRKTKPVLIDQASGAHLSVPVTAKAGPLRNSNEPIAGRTYFMFFANSGRLVKAGNRVTVEIGDFRAEDLVVK